MSRFTWLAVCAALLGPAISPAFGQHLSPEQLDRLSQERQSAIGSRNWGPPPSVQAGSRVTRPTPVTVRCMSPARDFEPLYAEPRASAHRVGVAAPQIAVTDQVHDGWRQVLRGGSIYAWIPDSDVVQYRPPVAGASPHCEVAGEGPTGMVLFSYRAK